VLFEVFFSGGRVAVGTGSTLEEGKRLPVNILAECTPATREGIAPYIQHFQILARRRAFLCRKLENTLIKFLRTLEFYEEHDRRKLAIALALTFHYKIQVSAENIFESLLHDRLVAKGSVLEVITVFFQEFLSKDSMDDLVSILTKGKVVNRLIELFPSHRRTSDDFEKHFRAAGLDGLVEWNTRREMETKIMDLENKISEMIISDPPLPVADVLNTTKTSKQEANLPEAEVVRVVWLSLMKAVNMTGKNQQQILQTIMRQIKSYHKLLAAFTTSGKLQLSLLITVQLFCYEDSRLMKVFSDIVRLLYDADLVGEDAVMHWYKKGSHPKGRSVFLKDIEPFIKWLEEAEEEEED
jgi:hypothetical protein